MEDRDAFSGPLFFIDVWVVSSVYIHGLTEVVGHHWECQWLSSSLVGGIPTRLKNMSSSVGMMTFPIYGKIKHVPNHQPEVVSMDSTQ